MAINIQLGGLVPSSVPSNAILFGNISGNSNFTTDGSGNTINAGSLQTGSGSTNYIVFSGAATLNSPTIAAMGGDTNVGFAFQAKGSGSVFIQGNFGNILAINNPNNGSANYLQIQPAATLNYPSLAAIGSDTDIGLALIMQGAGVVQFSGSGTFTANGSVATALTSLGPTGSHTTVQNWLTIKDNSGITRYIPCF